MSIGENLRRLRKKKSITQTQVKNLLGISSTSTVSMWETGKRQPKTDMLPKLAALFDCGVDEILRDKE